MNDNPYIKVSGSLCVSLHVCVPKDLGNRLTDIVLLYNKVFMGPGKIYLFYFGCYRLLYFHLLKDFRGYKNILKLFLGQIKASPKP